MNDINVNMIAFIIGVIVVFGILAGAEVSLSTKERELFAASLDKAMEKGIDPIAVKCAYDNTKPELCTTYVMRNKAP